MSIEDLEQDQITLDDIINELHDLESEINRIDSEISDLESEKEKLENKQYKFNLLLKEKCMHDRGVHPYLKRTDGKPLCKVCQVIIPDQLNLLELEGVSK